MKRYLPLVLAVFAVLCILSACGGEGDELSRLGATLGLDLSGGTLVRFEDNHGGFHGDGESFIEVKLDGLAEALTDAPGWKPLPMSENVAEAVGGEWGPEGLTIWMMGHMVKIEEGFCYFYDRHRECENPYDDAELNHRFSRNFTVAAYDSASGRLYCYELDT